MEIRDYSEKYAKEKDRFEKATSEVREDYKKNLKDLENTHKSIQDKRAQNHEKSLAKIEQDNRLSIEDHADKTSRALNRKKEEFANNLEDTKDNFYKESDTYRREMKRKLANAQDAYKEDLSNFKDQMTQREKGQLSGMDDTKGKMIDFMNKKERSLVDNFEDKMEKSNDDYRYMKQKLTDNYHDKTADQLKEHVEDRNDLIMENKNKIKEMRVVNANKLNEQDSLYSDQLQKQDVNFSRGREQMMNSFGKQLDSAKVISQDDKKKYSNDTAETIRNIIRDNSVNRNALDKEIAEVNKQRNISEESTRDRIDHATKVADDRVKNFKLVLDDNNQKYAKRLDIMNDKTSDRIAELKYDFNSELSDQEDLSNQALRQKEQDGKSDLTSAQLVYRNQEKNTRDLNQEVHDIKDYKYKQAVSGLKNQFGHSIEAQDKSHALSMEGLSKDLNRDKTEFIEKGKREFQGMTEEQRRNYKRNLQKTEIKFNQKIQGQDEHTEKMARHYENKIAGMEKKFVDEIRSTRHLFEAKSEMDRKDTKNFLQKKEQDYFAKLMDIKSLFHNKMAKDKIARESELNKFISRYEDKIKSLTRDHEVEMMQYKNQMEAKYKALQSQSILKEQSLTGQLEEKVNKLKVAYAQDNRVESSET